MYRSQPHVKFSSTLLTSLISLVASAAQAQQTPIASTDDAVVQEADQNALTDIVVTAERRQTSLQRTPIAVTALDGEALAEAQINDIRDFSTMVPSLKASETGGFGQITIRGIGIQNFTPLAESTVAVNLNQIYVSRPTSFFTGLYDVAAVEVLRGPQGTLYGRNATAGSVNIATNRPTDELSGFVNITVGNHDLIRAEAAVSGTIVEDVLKVRMAGLSETRGGYGKNIVTGGDAGFRNSRGLRGTIEFTPTPGFTATLIGEYYNEHSDGGYRFFGDAGLIGLPGAFGSTSFPSMFGRVVRNSHDVANDDENYFKLNVYALTGIVEYETGPVTFRSISGYRKQDLAIQTDTDGSDQRLALYYAGEPADQFSQELQVNYNSDRLNVTAGAYYFKETDAALPSIFAASSLVVDPLLPALGIPAPPRPGGPVFLNFANLGGTINTDSKAAYAQTSLEFMENLTATAGLRYTRDRKQLTSRYGLDIFTPYAPDAPLPADVVLPARTFESWTPRLGLQYQATPNALVYASYAKGFKAGGFDASANPAGALPTFGPETLTSYEVGLKLTTFERRLRANLAGFYYDYQDLQVNQTRQLGVVTQNAANARVYGIEGEITVLPVPKLQVSLNGSYLDSRYKSYVGSDAARPLIPVVDFSGKRLNNSPEFSGVFAAQYQALLASGELTLRGEIEFTTEYFFSPGNYDLVGQKGFAKGNLFATYRLTSGLSLTAFMRNVTDKITRTSAVVQTVFLGTPVQGSLAPPRTFGLQLSYRY